MNPCAALLVGALCWIPAPVADHAPRAADELGELARNLARKRDRVDPEVYERLAELGGSRALAALTDVLPKLKKTPSLERAYGAIASFASAPKELRDEARRSLTREVFHADERDARPIALRAVLVFGDEALPGVDRALREHADTRCRRLACDALVPRLAADADAAALTLLLDFATVSSEAAEPLMAVPAPGAASWTGLDRRAAVRRALDAFSGPESQELIVAKLRAPTSTRAWKLLLVDLLADRGGPVELDALGLALADPDPAVVLEVLERLEAIGAAEGYFDALHALLDAETAAVRRAAVVALGRLELREPRARAEILTLATHSDSALRMGSAVALVELRTPEAIDALHGLLEDADWAVRAEALAQVARLRDRGSLPLLVERIEQEGGRMRADVLGALHALSGLDLGRSPARWRRWWEVEGANFEFPSAAEVERREEERRARAAQGAGGTQGPTFYGVEVRSERVCFVLDVSGSMRLNAGPGVDPSQPADPDKPSRLDVAKEQLSDIVRGYPDGQLFNLIFFESEVRALEEGLAKMKKSVRQKALRFVREQSALGGTALYPALELAFSDPLVDTIYLISDGAPTEGEVTDIEEVRREVRRWNAARHVRIHGITIGQDSDLLRWLTADTGGTYTRRD